MENSKNNTQLPQTAVSVSAFLTGKAKQDFEKGIIPLIQKIENTSITDEKRCLEWIYDANNLIQIPHYIMWFDSIGITVDIMPRMNGEKVVFEPNTFCLKYEITTEDFVQFENRLDAQIKALEKANEIYNEKFV